MNQKNEALATTSESLFSLVFESVADLKVRRLTFLVILGSDDGDLLLVILKILNL